MFANSIEETAHANAITALATEIDRPATEVRSVYEHVYRQLKPKARIPDYLPLLVSRRARDILNADRRRTG
jgi:hypothetical protein